MRKITSYYKVQKVISFFKRETGAGNRVAKNKDYLDLGCGNNISPEFINVDYHWMPGVDVCMDISKYNLPINANTLKGIYTEHCLEHIPYTEIPRILKDFYRILKNGGVLRIVVPDGQIYLEEYCKSQLGEPYSMPIYKGYKTPMESVNAVFRNHGHQFIFDYETFEYLLTDAGFSKVSNVAYLQGSDPVLLKDTEWRSVESLYIEAVK
jgi:predicted SAM-dependent methyltransferase